MKARPAGPRASQAQGHRPHIAEGVLTLRARPPSEAEFVDCFQKTKLAINLLVSLTASSHILCADLEGRGLSLLQVCRLPAHSLPAPQAKLQKHIQNPSAAELVHFLFGPLDLVPGRGGQAWAAGVGGSVEQGGGTSAHLGQRAGPCMHF